MISLGDKRRLLLCDACLAKLEVYFLEDILVKAAARGKP